MPATKRLCSIDILCRVIDNYGDAGTVLRLARGLLALEEPLPPRKIRIFTDRPDLFFRLAPGGVAPDDRCELIPMDPPRESGMVPPVWNGIPAPVIIQAFDAGLFTPYRRMLEHLSAAPDTPERLLVNLEYLSAEEWTREYHLLPSLSGLPKVRKIFFLPGFRDGTGGLIHGRRKVPTADHTDKEHRAEFLRYLASLGATVPDSPAGRTWISLFSYEHDYRGLVQALMERMARDPGFRPVVLVAPGRGAEGFLRPWEAAGRPFPAPVLPFLPQTGYDDLVDACDINIVRGEESLARAALSGRPFLWHAYLQDEEWQMVKVEALLDCLCPHLADHGASACATAFRSFNRRCSDSVTTPGMGAEDWGAFLGAVLSPCGTRGFRTFSRALGRLGDLSANLGRELLHQGWAEQEPSP